MAYLDSTTAEGLTTQASVAVPAGVQANDIVIVAVMADPVRPCTVPSGFTQLDNGTMVGEGSAFNIGWKRLTGADTGTYDWGSFGGTATDWVAQAFAFRGRHLTDPPTHTENIVDSALSSPVTATATGLTALDGDDLLWVVMPDFAPASAYTTTTAPSGYTKQEDQENANGWAALSGSTKENVSAGATGSVAGSFTMSSGNAGYAAYLVRIPSAIVPTVGVDVETLILGTSGGAGSTATGTVGGTHSATADAKGVWALVTAPVTTAPFTGVPTYGGTNMTLVGSAVDTTQAIGAWFYFLGNLSGLTGPQTVNLGSATATEKHLMVGTVISSAPTTQISASAFVNTQPSGTDVTVNLTPTRKSLIVGAGISGNNGLGNWTVGADETEIQNGAVYGASVTTQWSRSTALAPINVPYTYNWVMNVASDWGIGAIAISATPQKVLPDADTTTTGWSTAPLFSKINDSSDATVITSTLA